MTIILFEQQLTISRSLNFHVFLSKLSIFCNLLAPPKRKALRKTTQQIRFQRKVIFPFLMLQYLQICQTSRQLFLTYGPKQDPLCCVLWISCMVSLNCYYSIIHCHVLTRFLLLYILILIMKKKTNPQYTYLSVLPCHLYHICDASQF